MSDIRCDSTLHYELEYRFPDSELISKTEVYTKILDARNNADAKTEVQELIDYMAQGDTNVEVINLTSVIAITSTVRERIAFP